MCFMSIMSKTTLLRVSASPREPPVPSHTHPPKARRAFAHKEAAKAIPAQPAPSVPGHPSTRQRCGVRNAVPLDRTSRHPPPKSPRADNRSVPVVGLLHHPQLIRTHRRPSASHQSPSSNHENHVNHVKNRSSPRLCASHSPCPPSRLRGFARDSRPRLYAPTEGPTGICPQKSGQNHTRTTRAIGSPTSARAPALWSAE